MTTRQRKGVGTHLFRQLIEIARNRGVTTFVAEVMVDNVGMINLFHKCALGPVQSVLQNGGYHFSFDLPPSVMAKESR